MATRFDDLLEPWRLGAALFIVFRLVALIVAGALAGVVPAWRTALVSPSAATLEGD
jgi:hypothetical protein